MENNRHVKAKAQMAGPPRLRRSTAVRDVTAGYTTSPTIAVICTALFVSYLALYIYPDRPYVFATMSNLCYVSAGVWRVYHAFAEQHSAAILIGQFGVGSIFLLFLGASSFAYHAQTEGGSQAHTLDIVGGWLLVCHLLYVTLTVAFMAVVEYYLPDRLDPLGERISQSVFAALFAMFVLLLFLFYDSFYSNQTEFFFITGPTAAFFGGICRLVLIYDGGRVSWRALRIAGWEVVVVLIMTFGAIFSQGELLGKPLDKNPGQPEAPLYDLYHGNWHFLLGMVACLLYSRSADAARVVKKTHEVVITKVSWQDFVGANLVALYAATSALLKETGADYESARSGLFSISCLLMIHALFVFYVQVSTYFDFDPVRFRLLPL